MNLAVFIPTRTTSRYSLLGAMGTELGEAFREAGCQVNPTGEVRADAGLFLFLNFPESFAGLAAWAHINEDGRPRHRSALLQFFVDHPLALDAGLLGRMAALPHYRLLMPCTDDTHWLRLRWPNLKHVRCWHGVPRTALCEVGAIERGHLEPPARGGRDIDVLVAGSIHSPEELAPLREGVPTALRDGAESMVQFMLEHPWSSFGQALELCMPSGVYASDHFALLQTVWRYATAALNRERRARLVTGLHGLDVTVLGAPAWREFCTGTIRYAGDAPYGSLPGWFARSRVALTWGPTQFVHAFSERLLLGLAAGCACVADDRLWVRREFAGLTSPFDAAHPAQARACVERLLADRTGAAAVAARGRACIESAHLWSHRLGVLGGVMVDALGTS